MRWKKFGIGIVTTILIAVPSALMIYIAAKPQPVKPTDLYVLNFKNQKDEQYVNNLHEQLNEVFNQYKKTHPNFKKLNLNYITLNSALTSGEINYFNELNKTLTNLNPDLGFNLQQPNPVTIQQGFYQQNTDMVSFYWSPDYNGLGTWLQYMFSNSFAIANLWQPLSQLINGDISASNAEDNTLGENWVNSLADKLSEFNYTFSNGKTYPIVTKTIEPDGNVIYSAVSSAEIAIQAQENKGSSNTPYTAIQNGISAWANAHNDVQGNLVKPEELPGYGPNIYASYKGGIDNYKPSMAIDLVNWMCSYIPNLPYFQNGPYTIASSLVKYGAHAPINSNATTSFRDWYYDPQEYSGSSFKWWNQTNPFSSTITPYNGSFNQSSGGPGTQTTFTTLYTWSTTGDYYNQKISKYKSNYADDLVSQGTTLPLKDFVNFINNGFSDTNLQGQKDSIANGGYDKNDNTGYIKIPIRAIPWVNGKGQIQPHFLSPYDYWCGLKGYLQSVNVNINTNGYFINLASINIKKTLDDPNNKLLNTSINEAKPFTIYFNVNSHDRLPELTGRNIADILSNSYFTALPSFSPLVQNIVNDAKFNKIAILNNGVLNTRETDMTKFYGCGDAYESWKNLYYVSAYYISDVTRQKMVFNLNKPFFGAFDDDNEPQYVMFHLNSTLSNGQTVQKFHRITMNYAGSYKPQITYEQFVTNQLDMSKIPESSLSQAYQKFPKSIYEPVTNKISQSNLIPYNTNIYLLNNSQNIILENNHGEQVNLDDPQNHLEVDKYGNFVFPKGLHPILKSRISAAYANLIVKNFFTPINARGSNGKLLPAIDRSSAIIRSAINNLINWYSLDSLTQPGQSVVMQNSFMPYGVFNTKVDSNDQNPRWKYWNIAAYKIGQENAPLGARMGGLVQWTWTQLISDWKQQFNKNINEN